MPGPQAERAACLHVMRVRQQGMQLAAGEDALIMGSLQAEQRHECIEAHHGVNLDHCYSLHMHSTKP